jgi:hypothetical protein
MDKACGAHLVVIAPDVRQVQRRVVDDLVLADVDADVD